MALIDQKIFSGEVPFYVEKSFQNKEQLIVCNFQNTLQGCVMEWKPIHMEVS